MPKVTEEHLEARRRQIIEAAAECFIEKGFKKTSMRDICRAAKLSPGAVYNYFTSKDKIIEAIAQVSQEQNVEIISSAAEDDNPLWGVAKVFFSMAKDPACIRSTGLSLELFAESSVNPQIARGLRENINASIRKLAEFVKSEQEKGLLNGDLNSEAIAQVLMVQFWGLNIMIFIDLKVNIDEFSSVFEAILNGRFSTRKRKENKRHL
ncbi:MAG: TetR family transcriptional regulator [Candidatus Aminicenantes bacterium]|nr:TetR family transcriptional regulator [Candidatus Aminicenantes bacterium]